MRINIVLTVAAAPVQVSKEDLYVSRYMAQMVAGGSGKGYVMEVQDRTPDPLVDNDISAELAPATATAPGGSYSDSITNWNERINLKNVWVHGTNAGDKIRVTAKMKV